MLTPLSTVNVFNSDTSDSINHLIQSFVEHLGKMNWKTTILSEKMVEKYILSRKTCLIKTVGY